jgi:opacity protein-like surface antigen
MKGTIAILVGLFAGTASGQVRADEWSAISFGAYTQLGHYNSATQSSFVSEIDDTARSMDGSDTTWNGGFSLAANWRIQNAVIGVGIDYDPFGTSLAQKCHYHWSDGMESNVYVSSEEEGRCTRDIAWSASFVGKAGWLASPTTLIYGLGGWTFSKVDQSFEKSFNLEDVRTTLSGPTFGGGFEYRLTESWHANLEFRYTKLETFKNVSFSSEARASQSTVLGGDFETVRLGLSYVLPIR